MRRTGAIVAAALLAAGCGGAPEKPVLTEATFRSIAQRCHAEDVSFSKPLLGEEPTIGFRDTVTEIGGRRVRVRDCVANDIKPYRIGQIDVRKGDGS